MKEMIMGRGNVMNERKQIDWARDEYRTDNFIKFVLILFCSLILPVLDEFPKFQCHSLSEFNKQSLSRTVKQSVTYSFSLTAYKCTNKPTDQQT